MNKRMLLLVVPAVSAGLFAAGCGSDDKQATNTGTTGTTTTETQNASVDDSPDSGASALRATLTAALQEHVYLAGIADQHRCWRRA